MTSFKILSRPEGRKFIADLIELGVTSTDIAEIFRHKIYAHNIDRGSSGILISLTNWDSLSKGHKYWADMHTKLCRKEGVDSDIYAFEEEDYDDEF